jgi:pSer/pThr/pTyr-binding forkhead associated (FHA) protein
MEAKLVVVNGKAKAEQFALTLPAILGRSRSADVPLNHPLVSRQHCELFESDGQLMVRDLGSLNGTFVDETRVTDEVVIVPGGHLTVGSVTFEAVYEAPESTGDDGPPDFEVDGEEEADLDQTIDISNGKRAPAEKPATSDSAAENDGFDMGWLDEGSDDEAEQDSAETEDAPAAHDTAEPSDLSPPLEFGDEEDEEVVEKPAAASRRGPPAKPAASGSKAPAPKKPASKSAAGDDEETIQFAPAEGHKPEGAEGDEDMDDFFRSLSEP